MGSSGWKAFNVPLLPLPLALILGICVGEYIPAVVSLISLVITLILLLFVRNHNKKIAKLLALASLIAVGAILIHLRLHPTIAPHHIANVPDRTRVMLAGTIYRPPQRQGDRTVIYLRTDSIYRGDRVVPATGKVRITIGDPALTLRYGHRVSLKAKLYRPRNFGNPGAFDYERYLRRQGVLVTGYVRGGELIEILEKGGNPLLRWFDHWREAIATFLDEHTLPPGRGLLKTLLIGERGEIPKEVKDNFIDAGAAHILAISGLHLGIIVTLVFFSIRQVLKLSERILLRFNIRKVAALATFPFLFCYILITGLPISTILT